MHKDDPTISDEYQLKVQKGGRGAVSDFTYERPDPDAFLYTLNWTLSIRLHSTVLVQSG